MAQNRQADGHQLFAEGGRSQHSYLVHLNGILTLRHQKRLMRDTSHQEETVRSPLYHHTIAPVPSATTMITPPLPGTLENLIASQSSQSQNNQFIIDEMQCESTSRSAFNCTSQEPFNQVIDFNPAEINFADIQKLWISKNFLDILFRVAFVAPIVLLGIVGNLTIIYSMFKFKPFRSKPTNIFILNMAIADLLTTMVCPTAALFTDIYQFYVLGSFICRFEGFVKITCLLVSSYSLIVLSFDWLLCVVQPCRTRITIKQSWITLATIWFLSVLMASPLFVWRKLRRRLWKDLVEVWCCEMIQYTKYYWVVITFFLIYLPTFIMTVVLVIILTQMDKFEAKLKRSRSTTSSTQQQGNCSLSINMKYRRRIVKILFTYLLTSIICWTPLQFTIIYRHFRSEAILSPWYFELAFFAQLSASLTAAMNPIIFGFLSQPFRRMVTKSLMFKFLDKIVNNSARSSADHPNNRIEIPAAKTHRQGANNGTSSRSQQKNHHQHHHHPHHQQLQNSIHVERHNKPPPNNHSRRASTKPGSSSAATKSGVLKAQTGNHNRQHVVTNCCSLDANNKRVSFNTSTRTDLHTSNGSDNAAFQHPSSFEAKLGSICETDTLPQQQQQASASPSPMSQYIGSQQNGKQINTTSFMQPHDHGAIRRPLSFVSMDSINIEENLGPTTGDGEAPTG